MVDNKGHAGHECESLSHFPEAPTNCSPSIICACPPNAESPECNSKCPKRTTTFNEYSVTSFVCVYFEFSIRTLRMGGRQRLIFCLGCVCCGLERVGYINCATWR
jgi:hypothetical protein